MKLASLFSSIEAKTHAGALLDGPGEWDIRLDSRLDPRPWTLDPRHQTPNPNPKLGEWDTYLDSQPLECLSQKLSRILKRVCLVNRCRHIPQIPSLHPSSSSTTTTDCATNLRRPKDGSGPALVDCAGSHGCQGAWRKGRGFPRGTIVGQVLTACAEDGENLIGVAGGEEGRVQGIVLDGEAGEGTSNVPVRGGKGLEDGERGGQGAEAVGVDLEGVEALKVAHCWWQQLDRVALQG